MRVVQFVAMYNGANHLKRPNYNAAMRSALDRVWAELASSFFRGGEAQLLAGAHSRDYDLLFGRGQMGYTDLYLAGLVDWPNLCSEHDLHCEVRSGFTASKGGPLPVVDDGSLVLHSNLQAMGPNPYDVGGTYTKGVNQGGSGLQNSMSLYNAIQSNSGSGYAPPDSALALADLQTRNVRCRFGNGTSDRVLYIQEGSDESPAGGFAIGSTSEDYVTNTHSFYT